MRLLLLAASLGLCTAASAAAQEAYVPLPSDHWSLQAVRRAEAAGLIAEYLPAQRTASREEVGRALREASESAGGIRPDLRELTRGWHNRFAEEFPETAGPHPGAILGGIAGLRWRSEDGRAAPGAGYKADFGRPPTGAAPLPDRSTPEGVADLAVRPGAGFGAYASLRADDDDAAVERAEVSLAGRRLAVSVGRGTTGYGYSTAGSVTLTAVTLDRVQIQTLRPVELPGGLGRMALHAQGGVVGGARHPGDPAFISVAITLRPHRRLTLAGYRAAILGGDSAGSPLTTRTFLQSLLGLTQNDENGFSNQVASLDLRWRLPTERVLPVTLYAEGGMEDLDVIRSVRDSPGGLVGIYLPTLPGLPWAAAGVERASFGLSCCGNGIWYRHFMHHGGWAVGDEPLGHPLGGHGRETAAYLQVDDNAARLRAEARGFRRFRGRENLYAPGRDGRSHGIDGRVLLRLHRHAEGWIGGGYEEGDGWRERGVAVGAAVLF